jgi:ribosome-binding protein aMBF1 (putative translation factor)
MSHQDWTPVILRKNTDSKKADPKNLVAKQGANKQHTAIKTEKVLNPSDPDGEPETRPVMIDKEFGQQIVKARLAKQMTQKDLANAISIPIQVINEYERGQGVRDGNYVSKIKNHLGINKHTNAK